VTTRQQTGQAGKAVAVWLLWLFGKAIISYLFLIFNQMFFKQTIEKGL